MFQFLFYAVFLAQRLHQETATFNCTAITYPREHQTHTTYNGYVEAFELIVAQVWHYGWNLCHFDVQCKVHKQ